jgi:hypothetical protein
MSSPIMPIRDLRVSSDIKSSIKSPKSSDPADTAAFVAELAAGEHSLTVEDARGGPPPEVLEQMATAGLIGEQMREHGAEVRFSLHATGRVKVELHSDDGSPVRTLSPTQVFDLAAGKPLR